jgi:predicted ATPase
MYHIKKFGIGNFRVFKEMQEFTLAPITILTGTNSSGKSSLTKAIMLLKESMINSKLSRLNFNDPSLKLGSFENNLNSGSSEKEMEFEIELWGGTIEKFPINSSEYYLANVELGEDGEPSTYKLRSKFKNSILEETSYWLNGQEKFSVTSEKINSNKLKHLHQRIILMNPHPTLSSNPHPIYENLIFSEWKMFVEKDIVYSDHFNKLEAEIGINLFIDLKNNIQNKIQSGILMNATKYQENSLFINEYRVNNVFDFFNCVKEGIHEIGNHYPHVNVDEFFGNKQLCTYNYPYSDDSILGNFIDKITTETLLDYKFEHVLETKLADCIKSISIPSIHEQVFEDKLENIFYIPGVRLNQEIIYTSKEYPIFYEMLQTLPNGKLPTDIIFFKKWLVNEFKIVSQVEDIQFILIEGYGFSVKISNERSLYQVGYGITQLLPIILQVALLENSVFIIEEPESNLHPALQSKLADFFIEASKTFNTQFIIETHSEYLIRKLQYLTAKKEIKPRDTQLYYFYPPNEVPEGEKQVYPINIQEDGSLTKNFGKGFFDEAGILDLLLYQMTKTRNN